jgi:hypothetical protein
MDVQCRNCGAVREMRYRGSVTDAAQNEFCCNEPMEVVWSMPVAHIYNGPYITSDRPTKPHASKRAMREHMARKDLVAV